MDDGILLKIIERRHFYNFMRMTPDAFNDLLELWQDRMPKKGY
jgi:hypothetical protein